MSVVPELTMKYCPVTEFSGFPPPEAVPYRGSRQVPVHVTGSVGALNCVSLYATKVLPAVLVPSELGSQRVFQNISLPLKKARFTPAPRAASTLARWSADQYSSCPTEVKTLWFNNNGAFVATSR